MEESSITELADKFINRIYSKSTWSRYTFFVTIILVYIGNTFVMFGFAFTLTPIDFKCDLNDSNVYQNFSAELNSCFITGNATNQSIACPTKFQFIPDKEFMQNSIVSDFQLICQNSYFDELLFTIFIWSTTVGDLICPFFFDKLGRQYMLLIFNFMVSFNGIAATLVGNYWILCVCIALMGFCRQFSMNSSYLLVLELMPVERLNMFGLLYQMLIILTTALIGVLAYFLRDWKQLQGMCLSIGLLSPLMWFVIPESPRWLITTGKINRLQDIMRRYILRFSSMTPGHFEDLMVDIRLHWKQSKTNQQKTGKTEGSSYLQVLRSKELMCWIFLLFYSYCYICTAIVAVNSFLTLEHLHRFVLYSGSSLFDVVYIGLVYFSPSNSRNVKLLLNQMLGTLCFIAIPFLPDTVRHLSFLFLMLGKATILGSLYIVQTTAIYIYPSSVRGLGTVLPTCLSRLFSGVAPFLITMYSESKLLPSLALAVMALSVGWLNLLYPELLDKPIPETIEDAKKLKRNIGFAGCKRQYKQSNSCEEKFRI